MKALLRIMILLAIGGVLSGCAPAPAGATPTSANPAPVPPTAVQPKAGRLLLATTTSTRDSGLLDFILPDFEKALNVKVDVVAVGSGQALKIGQDGNAEVLLVHSPAAEQKFMADGHGVRREDVMYNDYVIVGPASDPAGIRGIDNATKALTTIAEKQAKFVSRGDESGTHVKEKDLWKAANITPSGAWYISAGQGMGAVLTMSDEQLAYTLTDRATYLARKATGLQLEIMCEGDPPLFNPYGVIAVNPMKNGQIKGDLAQQFIDWLISVPVQEKIATFGMDEWGQHLFFPSSAPYLASKAEIQVK